jgi:hypothetical protein
MSKKIEDAAQSMIQNLEKNTGRSLAQWIELARASQLARHREIINFLKAEHGLTYGYANLVALKTLAESSADSAAPDDLVAAQYAGEKAELRPIYDTLVAEVGNFGSDVEISPKKAYVSLRRNKQFAIIQPSTKSRLDVPAVSTPWSATAFAWPAGRMLTTK